LFLGASAIVNTSMYESLPFNLQRDIAPVSDLIDYPMVMAAHPSVPAKTIAEFITYAKANAGKLNFGSGGPGTTPHLAGEMLKMMAGAQMTHIPYKGGGPALTDLMGGQIQFMLENIPSTLPLAKSGKVRALAVTALKRSPLVPDLPTLDEAGLKGYEIVGWNGLFVPAATPREVVSLLHRTTVKALDLPDMKERLAMLGAEGVGSSPDQFKAFVQSEIRKWARVVKDAGLKAE
ncbi:MAG: tripartite tricarboxylate transporter substrate-binding protein, partial [Burkholderiales bacterium]